MKFLSLCFPLFFLMTILVPSERVDFERKVNIIDNYQDINTFEELVQLFPGKVLYIDMWATWCGPCREEFSYTLGLKSYAEGKDIEFIYISLDKPRATPRWKRFIEQYKIEGQHLLANEQLRNDLNENYYSYIEKRVKKIYMPAYMIVDKSGRLFHRDARRPSEEEKLYKQLKKALKK